MVLGERERRVTRWDCEGEWALRMGIYLGINTRRGGGTRVVASIGIFSRFAVTCNGE